MENTFMKRLRNTLLMLCFAAQCAAVATAHAEGPVSADRVRRWQADKMSFYLVDVRSGLIFSRKHIEGAINIPAFIVAKKGLLKDKDIVLYDGGIGTMEAREAADKLSAAGYGKVFLLEGGLALWEAAGLPLKQQTGVLDSKLVEFVTARELSQAMRDSLSMVLVDLREPALFKAGSIPGAIQANPEILQSLSTGWQKDNLIVLFDNGNAESERQAEQLRRAGFKLVRYLYGGFPEWKK